MSSKAPPALAPRKQPQRGRSQATVAAILDATAQLLEQQGFARISTNHIAARAGISIGSLYQYFPNKEAICHALAKQYYQQTADRYLQQLRALADEPVAKQVRQLVDLNFDIAAATPALAKNLYVELSRIGGMDPMQAMREVVENELSQVYAALPEPLRPAHPQMIASIVTTACGALIADAVVRRPDWLNSAVYREQVCALILAYYRNLGWV